MGNNVIKHIKRLWAALQRNSKKYQEAKTVEHWPFPAPEQFVVNKQQLKDVVKKPKLKKATTRKEKTVATKPGLYANIHAKQERIKKEKAEGKPVEKMRKPGAKGAPTAKAFKESAKTAKK